MIQKLINLYFVIDHYIYNFYKIHNYNKCGTCYKYCVKIFHLSREENTFLEAMYENDVCTNPDLNDLDCDNITPIKPTVCVHCKEELKSHKQKS